jgi:hypothetical protein
VVYKDTFPVDIDEGLQYSREKRQRRRTGHGERDSHQQKWVRSVASLAQKERIERKKEQKRKKALKEGTCRVQNLSRLVAVECSHGVVSD